MAQADPATNCAAAVASTLLAGVVVAMQFGKLAPALPSIRAELGMDLVSASWLISLIQILGAAFAAVGGALADRIGLRRSMLAGLALLTLGNLAGASSRAAGQLLASRALEGCGQLMVIVAAPALLARIAPAARQRVTMTWWASYMPTGFALGVWLSAQWGERFGWRGIWWGGAGLCLLALVAVWCTVGEPVASRPARSAVLAQLRTVLTRWSPWLLALAFLVYAGQWMTVFSFLPTLLRDGGVAPSSIALWSALGVAANLIGTLGSGRLLMRGARRELLIAVAALVMAGATWVLFVAEFSWSIKIAAAIVFSAFGGLIPGALFAAVPAYAPRPDLIATTAGLMQQGSSLGQIIVPPLLASAASRGGGWADAWPISASLALIDLLIAAVIFRRDRSRNG